jgi:hypothetical protein
MTDGSPPVKGIKATAWIRRRGRLPNERKNYDVQDNKACTDVASVYINEIIDDLITNICGTKVFVTAN